MPSNLPSSDCATHVSVALPRGIVSVVQTPFRKSGAVDLDSLERLVQDTIDAGVDGLLAPVVASEVTWLSADERCELVRHISSCAVGRVPLIVGASADSPQACRAAAQLAEEVKAAAYLVAVPDGLYCAQREIVAFFRAVADGSRLPLLVQDLQLNGPGLDIEVIGELKECVRNLVGLKIETVPAGPKYTAVREVLGPGFYIAGGWAVMQLIEAMDRGIDAMIPESSMVRVYATIHRHYAAGQRDRAREIFQSLLPVLAFTNQDLATSIAFFKRLLVRKGLIRSEALRMPGFVWDRYNRRIADELIEQYLALEDSVSCPPR